MNDLTVLLILIALLLAPWWRLTWPAFTWGMRKFDEWVKRRIGK